MKMSTDLSPSAITARLREAAEATDLRTSERLAAKIDMSPSAITRRLRQVAALNRLCQRLARAREES